MAVTAFAAARIRNLFAVVILSGIFSLLAAVLYVTLNAVDVAFTEAAVGAGISTLLMLATLSLTSEEEKARFNVKIILISARSPSNDSTWLVICKGVPCGVGLRSLIV